MLQAWLIAVSPQPGVAVAIGTLACGLEGCRARHSRDDFDRRYERLRSSRDWGLARAGPQSGSRANGCRQAPLAPSPGTLLRGGTASNPLAESLGLPPHRCPS